MKVIKQNTTHHNRSESKRFIYAGFIFTNSAKTRTMLFNGEILTNKVSIKYTLV